MTSQVFRYFYSIIIIINIIITLNLFLTSIINLGEGDIPIERKKVGLVRWNSNIVYKLYEIKCLSDFDNKIIKGYFINMYGNRDKNHY